MAESRREQIKKTLVKDRKEVYEWIKDQPASEITERQRDVLVDHYVMGNHPSVNIFTKHPTSDDIPPHYCTWEGMGLILKKLKEKGQSWMENEFGYLLQQSTNPECLGDDRDHRAIGELMFRLTPESVVKASLKSVGIEV